MLTDYAKAGQMGEYMTGQPLVSVVIPVYNNRKWLGQALRSALGQTYRNIEVIVVDDGSKENLLSLGLLKNQRVRYYRNQNHGVSYSRNFGIEKARGIYIAFLDSDDFWERNKLEIQIKKMQESQAAWSQHSYYYFDERKSRVTKKINTYKYQKNPEKMMYCSFKVQTSCFTVRKDALEKYRISFDERKSFGEDDSFYQTMMRHYDLLCIDDYLGYFRIKASNAGKDANKLIRNRASIWRENKQDDFFQKNTTAYVRAAYRICSGIDRIFNSRYMLLSRILYSLPYLIFKTETIRLCFAQTCRKKQEETSVRGKSHEDIGRHGSL